MGSEVAVIECPPAGWMKNLRPGNLIWLVKEQCKAEAVSTYQDDKTGRCGQMFIKIGRRIDKWYVSVDGKGVDGKPLIRPLEGQLPDTPVELQSQEAEDLTTRINLLEEQIRELQVQIGLLLPFCHWEVLIDERQRSA